ncbi:hypothetical protein, partial [Curvivirga aplysinae]|uniref:hypothetical protein n=1 Tax=Curvivirga aplysinae TaxID=2529852 RepID=UPI0012BC88E6
MASEFIDGKKIIQEKPFLADQELKDFIQDKMLVSFGSSQIKSNLNNLSVIYRKMDLDGNMKVAMGSFPPLFGHDSSNEALGSFVGKWGVEGDKVIFADEGTTDMGKAFSFRVKCLVTSCKNIVIYNTIND